MKHQSGAVPQPWTVAARQAESLPPAGEASAMESHQIRSWHLGPQNAATRCLPPRTPHAGLHHAAVCWPPGQCGGGSFSHQHVEAAQLPGCARSQNKRRLAAAEIRSPFQDRGIWRSVRPGSGSACVLQGDGLGEPPRAMNARMDRHAVFVMRHVEAAPTAPQQLP